MIWRSFPYRILDSHYMKCTVMSVGDVHAFALEQKKILDTFHVADHMGSSSFSTQNALYVSACRDEHVFGNEPIAFLWLMRQQIWIEQYDHPPRSRRFDCPCPTSSTKHAPKNGITHHAFHKVANRSLLPLTTTFHRIFDRRSCNVTIFP